MVMKRRCRPIRHADMVDSFMNLILYFQIHFHGTKYEELSEYIDVDHLPSDYGGKAPPFSNEVKRKYLLQSWLGYSIALSITNISLRDVYELLLAKYLC